MTALATSPATETLGLEEMEVELLLEAIFLHYGYDFRGYARTSLRRRLRMAMMAEEAATVSGLQEKVLHDPPCIERLLIALSVNVTTMFRDPGFFRLFRRRVVPVLRTYPYVRVWHVGCSTGEEVYSLAILLEEEGLYDRARIYASDMHELALRRAEAGAYPVAAVQSYTDNYLAAGGRGALSEFYTVSDDRMLFRPSLRRNVVFVQHNLATDSSFNEFNVIFCRNVLIYFTKALQARVHELLYGSLARFGFLGLGDKESIGFTPREGAYEALEPPQKLYRRIG